MNGTASNSPTGLLTHSSTRMEGCVQALVGAGDKGNTALMEGIRHEGAEANTPSHHVRWGQVL